MISFRYHIASLVAVLLALAAGVALGAGVLQDEDEPGAGTSAFGQASTSAADQQLIAFGDAFAASLQEGMTAKTLNGRTVTVLVLPGATPDTVGQLQSAVGQAGGAVVSVVRVGADLVDASNKQLVDQLGGQLEAAATKVPIGAGAGTYDRIGTLLGYAIATGTPGGDAVDEQGKGILAGLSTASLVTADSEPAKRGNLVLVVSGGPDGVEDKAKAASGIVLGLVRSLDAVSGGVVLAGPASAAGPTGVLAGVRTDSGAAGAVSTVDTADHPAGAIATVLALAEQGNKGVGQYGGGPGAGAPRPGAQVAVGE